MWGFPKIRGLGFRVILGLYWENGKENGNYYSLLGFYYQGVSQNYGYLFGGPNNKDCSILGVYIGVPLFWGTTMLWTALDGRKIMFCGVSGGFGFGFRGVLNIFGAPRLYEDCPTFSW